MMKYMRDNFSIKYNAYVKKIMIINNCKWVKSQNEEYILMTIRKFLKYLNLMISKNELFGVNNPNFHFYIKNSTCNILTTFNGNLIKSFTFFIVSFLRTCCLVRCDIIENLKKIISRRENTSIFLEMNDFFPLDGMFFDIHHNFDPNSIVNMNIDIDERTLGYFMWKGNVDDIDEIVEKFSEKKIVRKSWIVRNDCINFLDKLSKRTGKISEYISTMGCSGRYDLLWLFFESKNIKYRLLDNLMLKFSCSNIRSIIHTHNWPEQMKGIFYFIEKESQRKKINIRILVEFFSSYDLLPIGNINYYKKELKFLETIVDEKNIKNKLILSKYILGLICDDNLEKLKKKINDGTLEIDLFERTKNIFNYAVLRNSWKCFHFLMNELKIKPHINNGINVMQDLQDSELLEILKNLKKNNVPGKCINTDDFLCHINFPKSHEFIIDNYCSLTNYNVINSIMMNRDLLSKYYKKINFSKFLNLQKKRSSKCKYTHFIELVIKDEIKLTNYIIKHILTELLFYAEKKEYNKLRKKFTSINPDLDEFFDMITINFIKISVDGILFAMEIFGGENIIGNEENASKIRLCGYDIVSNNKKKIVILLKELLSHNMKLFIKILILVYNKSPIKKLKYILCNVNTDILCNDEFIQELSYEISARYEYDKAKLLLSIFYEKKNEEEKKMIREKIYINSLMIYGEMDDDDDEILFPSLHGKEFYKWVISYENLIILKNIEKIIKIVSSFSKEIMRADYEAIIEKYGNVFYEEMIIIL
jgi:hypothetical protein